MDSLTAALRETLEVFDRSGTPRTTSEVAQRLDLGRRSTCKRLERLLEEGLLETREVGANDRVWWRPAADEGGHSTDTGRGDAWESVLEDVLGDAEVGVFVLGADLEVAWINDAAEEYFSLERADVLGRDSRAILEEDIAPILEDSTSFSRNSTADDEGDIARLECHVRPGDHRDERWLEYHSEPINAGPYAGGCVELYYDVTERRRSERDLDRERAVNAQILETSPVGIAVFEADGTIDRVNERMAQLYGTSRENLTDLSAGERRVYDEAGSQLAFEERPVGTVFETGDAVFGREVQLEGVDGQRRWLSISAVPFRDKNDNLERVVAVLTDVSQLKEQARALERQRDDLESELEEVFDRIDDAVHGLDTDWQFTYLNDRAEELLGRSEEELLGTVVWDAFPDDSYRSYREHYERAMETQEPVVFEEYSEAASVWLEVTAHPSESGLSVYFRDVTEHKERERELERQRERLAALNELNEVVHDITETVISRSTREEIETTVCDRLAEAQSYEFAWIGDIDAASQTVNPRAEAGGDRYLEDVTVSVDRDHPMGQGPAGTAVRSQEMQIVSDATTDLEFEPCQEHAETHGYRSVAVIPIVHEDTLYGLLGVHADRQAAFEGEEGEMIGQIGEIVAHAIASVERKQALMSDELLELEVLLRDVFDTFAIDVPSSGAITVEHTLPIGDDKYLVYGTATGAAVESVADFANAVRDGTAVRTWDDGECTSYELQMTEPPVLTTIPSLGGSIQDAVFEDGDCHLTLHLVPGADIRRILDALRDFSPTVELLSHRHITNDQRTGDHVRAVLTEELTDRQRAALEAAYHAGYFEWPREASGEDVADTLEVASPTFHQHLRLAQQKIFGSLL